MCTDVGRVVFERDGVPSILFTPPHSSRLTHPPPPTTVYTHSLHTYSGWCSNLHTHIQLPRQSVRQMARVSCNGERAHAANAFAPLERMLARCRCAGARLAADRSAPLETLTKLTATYQDTQRPSPHASFNATHSGCAKERSPDPSPWLLMNEGVEHVFGVILAWVQLFCHQ